MESGSFDGRTEPEAEVIFVGISQQRKLVKSQRSEKKSGIIHPTDSTACRQLRNR